MKNKKRGFTLTTILNFSPALVLNLLKDFFERSRISFNPSFAKASEGRRVFTPEPSRRVRTSAQRRSRDWINVKSVGFSLLELLIVIAIIGLISSVVVPNLQRSTPRYEREAFIARFNALVHYGWQQTLMTHKIYRVTVDIGKKTIKLEVESGEKDRSGESAFASIANAVDDTTCAIPDQIMIKQFFIEGFDMMTKFARSKTATTWFYIIPEGMVQNVVINFNDTKDLQNDKPRPIGLVLNPFSAQFKTYDTFQKP